MVNTLSGNETLNSFHSLAVFVTEERNHPLCAATNGLNFCNNRNEAPRAEQRRASLMAAAPGAHPPGNALPLLLAGNTYIMTPVALYTSEGHGFEFRRELNCVIKKKMVIYIDARIFILLLLLLFICHSLYKK